MNEKWVDGWTEPAWPTFAHSVVVTLDPLHSNQVAVSIVSTKALTALVAERDALREACQAMVDWDELEENAPPYELDGGSHFMMRQDACRKAFRLACAALESTRAHMEG